MTKEQRAALDTIVEAYKKAAEACGMEIEFDDYETFIKNNPNADTINIKAKIYRPVESITIVFDPITKKEEK